MIEELAWVSMRRMFWSASRCWRRCKVNSRPHGRDTWVDDVPRGVQGGYGCHLEGRGRKGVGWEGKEEEGWDEGIFSDYLKRLD